MSGLKATVVTVCYNAEDTIEKTMKSVLEQQYRPLEYILMDGASTDRTKEIIGDYKKLFLEKNIEFKFISEPDTGIYNAMNKGIDLATGDWIAFMNSGDMYHSPTSIEELLENLNDETDVIFGDELVCGKAGKIRNCRENYKDVMLKRLPFCHQAAFVKTELMKKYHFDEQFRITADYDFFLRLYFQKHSFQYVNCVVCDYDSEGYSAVNYKQAINETFRVKIKNGVINPFNPIQQLKRLYWVIKTGMNR